ncbi:Uncharacterized protein PBTT_03374 [Plasmodiophora brassicae]|uniref:Uncharacterized protein n=1 Tax=Plasmodiophora brassicae TaxID=37360 RepID=A0A0G4IJ10_PLABS|nr:hypothetical protein PBRA_003921 [Plasmodiophora brassicae]
MDSLRRGHGDGGPDRPDDRESQSDDDIDDDDGGHRSAKRELEVDPSPAKRTKSSKDVKSAASLGDSLRDGMNSIAEAMIKTAELSSQSHTAGQALARIESALKEQSAINKAMLQALQALSKDQSE